MMVCGRCQMGRSIMVVLYREDGCAMSAWTSGVRSGCGSAGPDSRSQTRYFLLNPRHRHAGPASCSSPLLYRNRVYCPSTYLIAPPTTLWLYLNSYMVQAYLLRTGTLLFALPHPLVPPRILDLGTRFKRNMSM